MIQFNLLPDVKIEYIKAQKMRQTFLSIAVLVTIASVIVFGLSFGANLLQKRQLKSLSAKISSETSQLKNTKEIGKILTVQNQLQSLTTLHDGKPAATRLFDYLDHVTPNKVSISSYNSDFVKHTISIVGGADTLSTVNKFVDTLKFTTYTSDLTKADTKAFSNVVLSNFGLAIGDGAATKSSFTIGFSYDPTIYDIKQHVSLKVPSIITTRSEVDKPAALFSAPPVPPAPTTSSNTGVKK